MKGGFADTERRAQQQVAGFFEQRVVQVQEDEMVNLKTLSQTYSGMNPAAAPMTARPARAAEEKREDSKQVEGKLAAKRFEPLFEKVQ